MDSIKIKKVLKYFLILGVVFIIVLLAINLFSNNSKQSIDSNSTIDIGDPVPQVVTITDVLPLGTDNSSQVLTCVDNFNGYIRLNWDKNGINETYTVKVYTNIDGGQVAIDVNGTSNGFEISDTPVDLNISKILNCSDAYWVEIVTTKNNSSVASKKVKWYW